MYESVTTDPDRSIMDSPIYDPEDAGIAPETSAPSPGSPGSNAHLKGTASSSSPKRSRRSVQKRVVTIPIVEAEGSPRLRGGAGDGAPPSDSWAWRKYGQKPIKGSPYPRGYYRCSSSKGCPARKQVERSRTDPTMLVVTYACDHNHSWPPPRNHHHQHHHRSAPAATNNSDEPVVQPTRFSPAGPDDKFPDLMIREEPPASDYYWFSDVAVGSPSATSSPGSSDDLLLGSIVVSSADVAAMTFSNEELGGGEEYEEELFAGLGELPECSVVFGRKLLVER